MMVQDPLTLARLAVATFLIDNVEGLVRSLADFDLDVDPARVKVRADPLSEGIRIVVDGVGAVPVEVEF